MNNNTYQYKVSICIPTYNGENVLNELMQSIVTQVDQHSVEIVISDDNSTDSTYKMAAEWAKKYSFINIYQNEKNLRMDRNFTQSAKLAKGEFVWLSGQDDRFEIGSINKFFEIIDKHEVNFIYFNYKFMNDNLTQELFTPPLAIDSDVYFESHIEYFAKIKRAPSFLPATIMKANYWRVTNTEQFFGTHYVQMGVWLSNFSHGKVFVVSSPNFILCRMPDNSWKYNDGQMLFEIFSGSFEVYKRIKQDLNNIIPNEIYLEIKEEFFNNFFIRTISQKLLGFHSTTVLNKRIKYLVDNSFVYYLYYLPILYFPKSCAVLLKFIKQKIINKIF